MGDHMAAEDPPLACSLAGDEFRKRVAWIAALAREDLRGYDREDLVLNLRYAPEAAGRVAEMVRKEQACCAFLTFAIHEDRDQLQLTITAPEHARAIADAVFESFIAASRE